MVPARRPGTAATALLALLLTATACGPVADRQPGDLRVGYDTVDGSVAVWPPRGTLAGDRQVTRKVTDAVRAWRSPVDDRAYLPSSGILWSGAADGSRLALVAADVPGEGASWLLQVTADGDRYAVTHATEYTDPGYLVYSDVLPVHVGTGRRYLVSARVERLLGPGGRPVPQTDGLTAPVAVPPCRAVPLTVTLRATESLPRGRAADRLLDLGTGTAAPRYPLVRDESGAGRRALTDLDTCALADDEGPFGSILRRVGDRDVAAAVPSSWPMAKISARTVGELTPGGGGTPAELEQLSWETADGTMTAVVHRPAGGGAPSASRADRVDPLQSYLLPVPGRKLLVLSWRATRDSSLSVPPGTTKLVDRPGLVVVPWPEKRETFSLASADETHYRSAGD
ncbi:hypothetical protein [Micromonospora endolithica]|uniref:Lipoprotein n=1 Tax=Micromonospora endolithica TaxID=230091 RepID=A0A3A9ZLU0_9ACTN|nr:hypothetical protein [Micromonospora endolithica]RKN49145.1 hypothetical protein D7223_06415 [Micromonospora endolithica]